MFLSIVKSMAVVLGALACSLILFEYLTARSRKINRSTISKHLRDPQAARSDKNTRPPSILFRALKKAPFISQSLKREEQQRMKALYRAELPKMFEIIALGMRVGLAFDQAFALYARSFSTPLAELCRERFEVWERGLITREAGLRDLSKQIELKEFERFVSLSLRALDYGAPLTHLLYSLADDARKSYRAERQTKVAKAPVKMLIPTGAFILPAMMMLVLGPIILDITGRMV